MFQTLVYVGKQKTSRTSWRGNSPPKIDHPENQEKIIIM
jgi:hypothetical protein